jgi:DNA-binding MarR family transcriptional regulator
VPDLDRYGTPLVRRLFVLHHLMMRLGDRLTAPLGLTSSRWMLLCSLARFDREATVTELATEALQSPQNISRMLAELESRGLVARAQRPGAGRVVFVRLTDAGERAAAALEQCGERFCGPFLSGFDAATVGRMEDDLARLIANLSAFEAELQRGEPASIGTAGDEDMGVQTHSPSDTGYGHD